MISVIIKDIPMIFKSDATIFAPRAIDAGTLSMLSVIDFHQDDKVLDLGCGYGVVGIFASKIIGGENVVMCDISETAVRYSQINAEINHIKNVDIKISDGYKNKLSSVFGGVIVHEIDGYYVFIAEKRRTKKTNQPITEKTMSKKLKRKYGSDLPDRHPKENTCRRKPNYVRCKPKRTIISPQ